MPYLKTQIARRSRRLWGAFFDLIWAAVDGMTLLLTIVADGIVVSMLPVRLSSLCVEYRFNTLELESEGHIVAYATVYSETGSKKNESMYAFYNMSAQKFV